MRLPEILIPQQTTNFPPKPKNFNKHIFTFVHIQFRSHSKGKRVKNCHQMEGERIFCGGEVQLCES